MTGRLSLKLESVKGKRLGDLYDYSEEGEKGDTHQGGEQGKRYIKVLNGHKT